MYKLTGKISGEFPRNFSPQWEFYSDKTDGCITVHIIPLNLARIEHMQFRKSGQRNIK